MNHSLVGVVLHAIIYLTFPIIIDTVLHVVFYVVCFMFAFGSDDLDGFVRHIVLVPFSRKPVNAAQTAAGGGSQERGVTEAIAAVPHHPLYTYFWRPCTAALAS